MQRLQPTKEFLGIKVALLPEAKEIVSRKAPGKQQRLSPAPKGTEDKDAKAKEARRRERAEQHRRSLFISYYLKKPNATQAALLAGYSPANAANHGSSLLKDPYVKEKVESAIERMQERTEVTLEKVIRELAKLGMSNMSDYVRVNAYGEPEIDLSEADPDQWAAIQEVTTETYMEGAGDDARPVKRVKIKLYDKGSALDKLARLLGGYKGKGGGEGGDDLATPITHYTLQIGNANIVVNGNAPGESGGTEGSASKVLTLPGA